MNTWSLKCGRVTKRYEEVLGFTNRWILEVWQCGRVTKREGEVLGFMRSIHGESLDFKLALQTKWQIKVWKSL